MTRYLAFAPAAAWALVILWLGSQPALASPVDFPFADKVGHFGMFGLLGALLAFALYRVSVRASIAWPLVFGAAVGVLDELHQRSVPGRSSDWRDLVADVAGLTIGLWLTHIALDRLATRRTADSEA